MDCLIREQNRFYLYLERFNVPRYKRGPDEAEDREDDFHRYTNRLVRSIRSRRINLEEAYRLGGSLVRLARIFDHVVVSGETIPKETIELMGEIAKKISDRGHDRVKEFNGWTTDGESSAFDRIFEQTPGPRIVESHEELDEFLKCLLSFQGLQPRN